jgi:hypothetical protein
VSYTTLTITCPHILDDTTPCEAEIEVECDAEPGEVYGADADGNRGIWVGPTLLPNDPPTTCPECGCTYTTAETSIMAKKLEQLAEDYDFTDSQNEDDYEE